MLIMARRGNRPGQSISYQALRDQEAQECTQGHTRRLAAEAGSPSCFALNERAEVFGGELRPVWLGISKAFLKKSLYRELVLSDRAGGQAGDVPQMVVEAPP